MFQILWLKDSFKIKLKMLFLDNLFDDVRRMDKRQFLYQVRPRQLSLQIVKIWEAKETVMPRLHHESKIIKQTKCYNKNCTILVETVGIGALKVASIGHNKSIIRAKTDIAWHFKLNGIKMQRSWSFKELVCNGCNRRKLNWWLMRL